MLKLAKVAMLLHCSGNINEYVMVNMFANLLNDAILVPKMYNGYIPMLTKGPFALFYGGQPIVHLLSSESPPLTLLISLLVSSSFQGCLLIYKRILLRKVLFVYNARNKNKSLVFDPSRTVLYRISFTRPNC